MKTSEENFSKARITGLGTYVPENILNNDDLEKMVDTNDEWIVRRTGVKERRITSSKQFTTDLGVKAVEDLMMRYKKSIEDVDLILVATSTPDYSFPSVASQIQARLKIPCCGAIDLNAACAGFVYGLQLANGLITSGMNKKILVIGAETLSKITDYSDRTTCILFGDGSGAALIEYDEYNPSFLSSHMGSNGDGGIHLYKVGLSKEMNGIPLADTPYLVQNGREVYKWAVKNVPIGVKVLLDKIGLTINDIDWFIPHSANLRMIESMCDKMSYPMEKALTSVEYFGNTSAASIPLSLDIAIKEGKLNNNQKLVLYGFGGGLVHAGVVINWNI
ncbi:ketoacyl-ACP synthase III [Bacillus cereus]|nr:ketoacyl-ACP synthase III [Bacillus cereus]